MNTRIGFGCLAAVLTAVSSFAAAPTASVTPNWWGAVNNSFIMRYSGDNGVTDHFEVQVKYEGESEFAALGTVALTVSGTAGQISSVAFDGSRRATFRVRRVNGDGAGAWWTSTQTTDPSLTGTVISTPAESGDAHAPSNVTDGDYSTNYDSEPSTTEPRWIGFDFGSPQIVRGVRYFGSYGKTNDNKLYRLSGAVVEVANSADFSDATVGYTIGNPGVQLHSCALPSPVVGRYARVRNLPSDGVLSVAELGFVGEAQPAGCPAAPFVSVACVFNRRANFCVTCDAHAVTCRIQRKRADDGDSAWADWRAFSNTPSAPVNVVGDADVLIDSDFRFRAENGDLASDWTVVRLTAPNALTGTVIGSAGSYNNCGNVFSNSLDGSVFTWFDAPATPVPAYVGLDLGTAKRITGVRYMPRADRLWRVVGMKVEIATQADFSDATEVCSITETPTENYRLYALEFAEPVSARYVRLSDASPSANYCNVAEVEFETDALDLEVASLAAESADRLNGGYPTVSWTDASSGAYDTVVQRATAAGGPWTEVASLPHGQTSWQDTTAASGVRYYYNVAYVKTGAAGSVTGRLCEVSAAYRRIHRLERTTEDNTKLKSGVRVVLSDTRNEGNSAWRSSNGFDGDVDTNVSCPVADTRLAVVFDTEKVGVECVRAHTCKIRSDRLQRARVYATDGNFLDDNPQVSVGCFPYGTGWVTVECNAPTCSHVYYLMCPDYSNFYSCLSELELYGWTASEESSVLIAPTRLSWRVTNDGVILSWDACNRAATYRVERRAGEGWTTLATVSATTYTDTSATLNESAAYRVVSLPAEGGETAISRTFSFVPYLPGAGTGLTGVYSSTYVNNSWSATEEALKATNQCANLDFDWQRTHLLAELGAVSVYNARARWYGRLIVPVTGTYSFRADTAQGCSLGVAVDGRWALNADNVASSSVAGNELALTAGEHAFYAEFMRESTAAKFVLHWKGPIAEEIIPASQFIPAPPHDFGDWTFERTFNARSGRLPNLAKAFPLDDGILFNRGRNPFDGQTYRYHALSRAVRGDFTLTFHLKAVSPTNPVGQRFGVMVSRDDDPVAPMVFAHIGWSGNMGGQGAVCTARRETSGLDATVYSAWTFYGLGLLGTSGEADIRVSRASNTVMASYFDTQSGSWVEIMRESGTEAFLGRIVRLSLACTCFTDSPDEDIAWKVSDIAFQKNPRGLFVIVK